METQDNTIKIIEASYSDSEEKSLRVMDEDDYNYDNEGEIVGDGTKATREDLNDLHKTYTKYLLKRLNSGEELSPGELSAIGAHLKNNNIVADIMQGDAPQLTLNSRIKSLLVAAQYSN